MGVADEIQQQSQIDEAQPADAIIVLGAAEYRGKPSPVLEARLNHALFLYLKGMAPRIITTGGAGGDPVFTEGSVGRSYLAKHGVPPEAIVVEREGESTAQSVAAVVEIMRRMNLRSRHRRKRRLSYLPREKDARIERLEGLRLPPPFGASRRLAREVAIHPPGDRLPVVAGRHFNLMSALAFPSKLSRAVSDRRNGNFGL